MKGCVNTVNKKLRFFFYLNVVTRKGDINKIIYVFGEK